MKTIIPTAVNNNKKSIFFNLFGSFNLLKIIVLFAGLFSVAIIYNTTFAADPDDGFIISEYIEGSSYNKAIELYNGTNSTIDLSQYKLNLYSNGSPTVSASVTLVGTLNKGDTYVIAHGSADATILAIANTTNNSIMNFNGDDAISLSRLDDSYVDVFGQIGFDPGTKWDVDGVSTLDKTLVRKSTIGIGDADGSDIFDPSLERDQYNQNTFSYLGTHSMDPIGPIDNIAPIATINLHSGQISPTISLTGKFVVTFSEAINTGTFTCDDIDFIGTAPGQNCISITEISPNDSTTFEVTTTATNDGTIIASIASGKIADLAGNLNDTTTITNNTIIIDRSSLRLSPGDIIIVTANANPDFFEFLVRKHLNAGTIIYFSDNGRNEDDTWRTGEGAITFTSTTSIDAGTIISVQGTDTSFPSLIQNTLGTVTKTDNFDIAVNGDNILAYQGDSYDTPTPIFIYGFGFAIGTPWITSGSPTANTSYLPGSLTLGSSAFAYIPGAHKSAQYICHNTALLSDTFLSDIHTLAYRTGNTDGGYFGPISCTFDVTKPQLSIDLADEQNTPTSGSTIKFLVIFSETIDTGSFTCSDIGLIGTVATKTCDSISEISPNNGTKFEITVNTTNNGFLKLEIEPDKITDIAGNPNDWPTVIDDSVIINVTPPYLSEVTSIATPSNNTTPNYTFHSTEGGEIIYSGSCSSSTTIAVPGNNTIALDSLSEGTYSDCTITVTDNLGSISDSLTISAFTIDLTLPLVVETIRVPNSTSDTTPDYTFTTDEAGGTIVYGGDCSSPVVISIAGDNTITFDTLSEGEHNNCTIMIIDEVGNTGTLNVSSFTIDTLAPTISEITPVSIPTEDTTPDYTFNSDEGGNIIYGGSCSSSTTIAVPGNNTITLDSLSEGTYSDCIITVTDLALNNSNILPLSSFTITASNHYNGGSTPTLHIDNCPNGDYSESYYDNTCGNNPEIVGDTITQHTSAPIETDKIIFSRKRLAQFVVPFAKEAIFLKANTEKSCVFIDIENESIDNQKIIQEACQLNLMGVQKNGITSLEAFRPNEIVTRNEFITTISRLIFGETNNILLSSSLNFYYNHIVALQKINLLQYIGENISESTIVDILNILYKNPNIIKR